MSNKIGGYEALERMRELKHSDKHFSMIHETYDRKTNTTNGRRQVEKCRLRISLPKEKFEYDTDLYLCYTDLEGNKPRMCFKKLIRFVAFPPEYKMLKVNWYEE